MIGHFDRRLIGYFTSPYPDAKPDFEPEFPASCPYCGTDVTHADVRTLSVAWLEGREVSAFIRCHRECNDSDEDNELDGKVLDTIGEMLKSGEIAP